MKKVLLGLGVVAVIGALGFVGAVSAQPDHIHLERQIVVEATAADVAPFAHDLELVNAWSPWDEKDPDLQREYSESTTGVGAWYAWEGNDEVGSGKMTVLSAEEGEVVHSLEFYAPFEGQAEATIAWTEAEGKTTVTWGFDQDADFGTKAMTLFMSFEEMLGPDYEAGLAMLKPLAEEAAKERIAEEKEAALALEAAAVAEEEAGPPQQ